MICDVCQTGVISPVLFTVDVDYINERLIDSEIGCFIGDFYLGCIMYADKTDPNFGLSIHFEKDDFCL